MTTNRREPFTFDAFDPPSGTCKVYIRERRLLMIAKLGRWKLLEARELVPAVLEAPSVVFEGLRWEGDEDKDRPGWRCYCGKPRSMYDKRGGEVGSDPNQVFLVFVNDEGVAYNWRWEFATETDKEIPAGEDRFISKVFDKRGRPRNR
jgi:hypothetical protein